MSWHKENEHCSEDGNISLMEHAQANNAPIHVVSGPVAQVVKVGDWCVVKYINKEFPGEG